MIARLKREGKAVASKVVISLALASRVARFVKCSIPDRLLIPWKIIIMATSGKPVITGANNLVLVIYDTGTHLCVRVFATTGR